MFKDLIQRNRSYRRFHESERISEETLRSLVDYARLAPSGANKQTLRYWLASDPESKAKIFPTLGWAGYLTEWKGPEEGERPSGYIVILEHKQDKMVAGVDHGIAAQSILLGAVEMGLGGCIIGNIQRPKLKEALAIPEDYEVLLVLALGKPKEEVVIEDMGPEGNVRYWRDDQQVHHVPKRALDDLIVNK